MHFDTGANDLAIRCRTQALRTDPLIGENHHQNLMAHLASMESHYAAIEHYRRFVKCLRDDFADTPMLETMVLAGHLKAGEERSAHQIEAHAPSARRPVQLRAWVTLPEFERDGAEFGALERTQMGLGLANALQPAETLDEVAHLTLDALGEAMKLESLFISLVDEGVLRINRVWVRFLLNSICCSRLGRCHWMRCRSAIR